LKTLLAQYLSTPAGTAFESVVLRVMHSGKAMTKTSNVPAALADLQRFTLSHLNAAYFTQLDEVAKHTLITKLLYLLMVADESVASPLIRSLSELPLCVCEAPVR
jgi:hypothetical protein